MHRQPDAHAHSYANPDPYSYSDTDTDTDAHPDADANVLGRVDHPRDLDLPGQAAAPAAASSVP